MISDLILVRYSWLPIEMIFVSVIGSSCCCLSINPTERRARQYCTASHGAEPWLTVACVRGRERGLSLSTRTPPPLPPQTNLCGLRAFYWGGYKPEKTDFHSTPGLPSSPSVVDFGHLLRGMATRQRRSDQEHVAEFFILNQIFGIRMMFTSKAQNCKSHLCKDCSSCIFWGCGAM